MRRVDLLALSAVLLVGAAPAKSPVSYKLSPVIESGALTALAVEIRLSANPDGVTQLDLPDHWAGETELWRGLRDLSVEGATVVEQKGSAARIIRSRPNASLVVRYRVVSGAPRELNMAHNETGAFKLHLTPDWFYTSGEAVFVSPHDRTDDPVRFEWTGAPAGFAFASDLEHLAGGARAATRPGVVGDVLESVLLGGKDVQVFTHPGDAGFPVRVAMRGRFAFDREAFANLVAETVDEERAFWGSEGASFLVTLGPVEAPPGAISLGGTGRTDAFMLAITPDTPLQNLRILMEHEYFHTWNPRELGGLRDGLKEPLGYWFSEGFTDFFAWRLLVRSGRLSPQEWADAWNDALAAYGSSAVKTAPNARVAQDFWKDQAVQKLPYQRGAMLAAIWDQRLRRLSGGRMSLDTVLQAQRRAARGRSGSPGVATLFPKIAHRYGLEVRADVARVADRGETITLPRDVFGPCATVETTTQPAFDRGWDVEATSKAQAIAGLRKDSPAYSAGLRNGMVPIKRLAGKQGDSRVEYVVQVKVDAVERVFRFMPEGKEQVTLQKVRFTPGVDTKLCARSLSGA